MKRTAKLRFMSNRNSPWSRSEILVIRTQTNRLRTVASSLSGRTTCPYKPLQVFHGGHRKTTRSGFSVFRARDSPFSRLSSIQNPARRSSARRSWMDAGARSRPRPARKSAASGSRGNHRCILFAAFIVEQHILVDERTKIHGGEQKRGFQPLVLCTRLEGFVYSSGFPNPARSRPRRWNSRTGLPP